MRIKSKLKRISKKLLIGRNFSFIDKIIFYFSNKNYSGWLLGNNIRSLFYGKKKSICYEPLILIGGFPRSGTTLLRAILEQHKNIASPETEIHLLQDIKEERKLKKGFEFLDKEIEDLRKDSKDLILFSDRLIKKYKKRIKKNMFF